MKLKDIKNLKTVTDYEMQRDLFLCIELPDIQQVKYTEEFLIYLKMAYKFLEESFVNDLLAKCNYSEKELRDFNIKSRRVSWDPNLTEIKEIEGRNRKRSKDKICYDFDLKKIQSCDIDKVKEILNELNNQRF